MGSSAPITPAATASKRNRRGRTPAAPSGSCIVALGGTGDTPADDSGGVAPPQIVTRSRAGPAALSGPPSRTHHLLARTPHSDRPSEGREGSAQPRIGPCDGLASTPTIAERTPFTNR